MGVADVSGTLNTDPNSSIPEPPETMDPINYVDSYHAATTPRYDLNRRV